jgi:hypothetical protein
MTKLSERAMLVSLSISSWSGMAVDKEVTEATNEDFKAAKNAGRYNKRLAASSFFTGVAQSHTHARQAHNLFTLPWERDGTGILAASTYVPYTTKMKDCRLKTEAEVKLLVKSRDAIIEEAKVRLGDMFNVDDYPTEDEIKAKFSFDVEIKPVPDAGDFRAELSNEATAAIVKDIERRTQQRIESAMDDVFKRVQEVVKKMSERLRSYTPAKDGKKATGIIRDNVVYNIHELANLLPLLNVTNDPRIDELKEQMLNELVEFSPELLRADAKVRAQTLSKADKLLRKVNSYLR